MNDAGLKRAHVGAIPVLWAEPDQAVRGLIIWLPGFSGGKESVSDYLRALAAVGFIGLSFDPVEHGERSIEGMDALRARVRGNIRRHFWPILAQTAEETPLMIDWAVRELGMPPAVGMGGISMGGDISVTAAGLDHRIRAVAAGCATADWLRPGSSEAPGEPDAPAQACYDRRNPLTNLTRYVHCPALSFQCGANDRQVPPDGAQCFVAALHDVYTPYPDRLEVLLEPGVAHAFTRKMWINCIRWFTHRLH